MTDIQQAIEYVYDNLEQWMLIGKSGFNYQERLLN
jgi:hypothetical protein